ncbi:osteocalcin isoform X1 [Mustela putorius furo]|uniref:Osteocalcin n=1 Tax=Mustela putorius furo TaxID=9669 RepID=A0A8U0V9R4_MUSPF|nr:osteocalcin isoform X1 [Mustela putorius furo]
MRAPFPHPLQAGLGGRGPQGCRGGVLQAGRLSRKTGPHCEPRGEDQRASVSSQALSVPLRGAPGEGPQHPYIRPAMDVPVGMGTSALPWDAKPSGAESRRGAAFVAKREGSEVVRRLRRYLDPGLGAPAPYPDPLEPKREVCELNPDCDELADHIGFQDAYRRFYGTA